MIEINVLLFANASDYSKKLAYFVRYKHVYLYMQVLSVGIVTCVREEHYGSCI